MHAGDEGGQWHADNEDLFQARLQPMRILSLPFGAKRRFEMREYYQHRIPVCRATGKAETRINLTWRWIAQHGQSCAKREKENKYEEKKADHQERAENDAAAS